MWVVSNKTPFSADYAWVIDNDGNKIWMVVVKATFQITPDRRCLLAPVQEPVRQSAVPYGEMGSSSLRYESDLQGIKPTTDVLVVGDAVVPHKRLAAVCDVSLRAGALQKRLRVTGNRVWQQSALGPKPSNPEPFSRMPLVYERAFGGWDRTAQDPQDHRLDRRNPVGTGFAISKKGIIGKRLPNVEYAGEAIRAWIDRPNPAGLNAVDCAWSPRRELAGTYDERWQRTRFPLWAADFDPRFRNCAPADQQTSAYLTGGERVEITGMNESGSLTFDVPRAELKFRTRLNNQWIEHEGHLSALIIHPNMSRFSMAWQTGISCNRHADALEETLVVQRLGGAVRDP